MTASFRRTPRLSAQQPKKVDSYAMKETLAVATPNWKFDLQPTGPDSWRLRVTNHGTLSSTFVPVRAGISGDSSASVEDFSFTTANSLTLLHPGETLVYEIRGSISQRAKRSWQKDHFKLELSYIAIYGIGSDDIAIPLPEWVGGEGESEDSYLEFDAEGDLG